MKYFHYNLWISCRVLYTCYYQIICQKFRFENCCKIIVLDEKFTNITKNHKHSFCLKFALESWRVLHNYWFFILSLRCLSLSYLQSLKKTVCPSHLIWCQWHEHGVIWDQGSISSTFLRAAFTHVAPLSVRTQSSCQYLFTLFGICACKSCT